MALTPYNRRPPPTHTSRWHDDGAKYRHWLDEDSRETQIAINALGLGTVIANPTYSSTVAPDLSKGAIQVVTVTSGSAFTIAAPINVTQLAEWDLIIVNASGGGLGTVTFDPSIHQAGFTAPGNGQRVTTKFYIEAINPPQHWQLGAWSAPLS